MKASAGRLIVFWSVCSWALQLQAFDALPENLASQAVVSATSEYSDQYLARFAVDGKIPAAGSRADQRAAWCVRRARSGDTAEFVLEWREPVRVGQIIYWGRTAFFTSECWKDYEVYLDDATEPAVRGQLRLMHGPQPIDLPPSTVRRIRLKFLNSYGGPNPGASEIQVFTRKLSRLELRRLARVATSPLAYMPWVEQVDFGLLRRLIERLAEEHGRRYCQRAEHLARLQALQQEWHNAEASSGQESARRLEQLRHELERLERQVLLWDVDELLVIKRHEINASHVYTYHYEGFLPGGGLYVVSVRDPRQPPRLLVASPEGQILDCDLSYDGRTVLFSWRRKQDEGYHLWTVGIDGSRLRQLTDGPWHDYNACWLPDGGIAFLSTRTPQFAYCWHAPVGVLYRMEADGSEVRRLSGNYLNDFTPSVLRDGRILYTRWEYVDRPAIPIQSLWTINPDGTGLSVFFGNRVISPGTFMHARSIPGTDLVICTMTGHNGPTRGAIGMIDRGKGDNAQAAITNLTPDVPVPKVHEGNGNTSGTKQYSCPYPLDRQRFLVSIRGPVLVRTLDGTCQSVALDAPDDGMQYFYAQPVRPRRRPPVIPSSLPAEPEPYATLVLQDIYIGLEPYVKRGEVTHLRIVRELQKPVRIDPRYRAFGFQFPVISCGATYAAKEVIGEVPIGPDGFACFRVPAGVPIYFQAVDAQGRAVQRMRSFTHLMAGEVQSCVGCHEPRNQTSRPKPPLLNYQKPIEPEPPEWGRGGFDYARIVQPIWDRHCVKCHNAREPAGNIDLSGDLTDFFNVSYDVLAREQQGPRGTRWVNWIPTYNGQEQNILQIRPKTWGSPRSRLAEVILSGHPDKSGQQRIELSDLEQRRIFAWIDLNVPYYGTSETAYPDRPGCRRLYPPELDRVLADVAERRCSKCHTQVPRRVWTRITNPELNAFLLAPLAKSAGGTERCETAVFPSRDDPDYQAILATFQPILETLAKRPRMDMPGAVACQEVDRSCK
ncbi:MAG: hypothetical protein GXP27_19535 [Planctomycetes bacterium]|nr:hypothetical protein [Planctomycetota bacterium]